MPRVETLFPARHECLAEIPHDEFRCVLIMTTEVHLLVIDDCATMRRSCHHTLEQSRVAVWHEVSASDEGYCFGKSKQCHDPGY